ncbi:MAG: hypothetical protein FGM52_13665, partial [Mycobacterium sp.]|nr:hypothetical protein [Mycobacterium sp.]
MSLETGPSPDPPTAHVGPAADPFGWIAEPTAELLALLDAERGYYESRIASLAALRSALAAEMTARVPAVSESAPWRSGAFTYRLTHRPGTEFPALTRTALECGQEVLIDLQRVADAHPGAEFHPGELRVSPDGMALAWSADVVGDERYRLRFRDVRTGSDLPEVIEATFPDGAWSADASTYLYLRTDAVNRPFQVWAHRLGTDPTSDRLVFEEPDQRFELTVEATRSGSWLVITATSRDTSEAHLLPAADP